MNVELKSYYDEVYLKQIDNEEGLFIDPDSDFIDYVNDNFKDQDNLDALDLGYGAGNYSLYLLNKGYNVTSVDFINSNIFNNKIPLKLKDKCNIISQDLNNYEYKDKYNIIICRDVLHYLLRDSVIKLLKINCNNTLINGINYLTIFTDIKRIDKNGNIKKIKGEADFKLAELLDLIRDIYKNWEQYITVIDYCEKDKYDKDRNYFTAKKLKIILKKIV